MKPLIPVGMALLALALVVAVVDGSVGKDLSLAVLALGAAGALTFTSGVITRR